MAETEKQNTVCYHSIPIPNMIAILLIYSVLNLCDFPLISCSSSGALSVCGPARVLSRCTYISPAVEMQWCGSSRPAGSDGRLVRVTATRTNTHTHTHVCACINMHESCTHAPGCYLGKNTFTLIKKCMSFVLSEININEEVWFGMVGCSLITSVCVLVFAEEDAGKAGRVRVTERNTNADAYLCSVPALTVPLESFTCSRAHWKSRRGDCWLWAH